MSIENHFPGRAHNVAQIGEVGTINVHQKPKRTKLFVIGYVAAVLVVFGGVGAYFLTSDWIREAMASRSFGLRVMTSTVSSPAIVPITSPQPA